MSVKSFKERALELEIYKLTQAVNVLAMETRGWRRWYSLCKAMGELRPQESRELNETADNAMIHCNKTLRTATQSNLIAALAIYHIEQEKSLVMENQ